MTNILAAHYQQQHKHRLAESQLLKGVSVCVCVWDFVDLNEGKEHMRRVLSRRKVLPSGTRAIT